MSLNVNKINFGGLTSQIQKENSDIKKPANRFNLDPENFKGKVGDYNTYDIAKLLASAVKPSSINESTPKIGDAQFIDLKNV